MPDRDGDDLLVVAGDVDASMGRGEMGHDDPAARPVGGRAGALRAKAAVARLGLVSDLPERCGLQETW